MDIKVYLRNDFVRSIDLQEIRERENKFTLHLGNKQTWTEIEDINGRMPRKIKSYITNIILYDLVKYDYKNKKRKFITKRGTTAVIKSTNQAGICLLEIIGQKITEVRSLYNRIVSRQSSPKTNPGHLETLDQYQQLSKGYPFALSNLMAEANQSKKKSVDRQIFFSHKN